VQSDGGSNVAFWVVDPLAGWHEPSRRAAALLRADPTELAAGWAARVGEERQPPAVWLEAETAARAAVEEELEGVGAPTEPGLQLALGAAYGDGELVYTASSMPIRDQEAFLPATGAEAMAIPSSLSSIFGRVPEPTARPRR